MAKPSSHLQPSGYMSKCLPYKKSRRTLIRFVWGDLYYSTLLSWSTRAIFLLLKRLNSATSASIHQFVSSLRLYVPERYLRIKFFNSSRILLVEMLFGEYVQTKDGTRIKVGNSICFLSSLRFCCLRTLWVLISYLLISFEKQMKAERNFFVKIPWH